MDRFSRSLATLAMIGLLALGNTGCIKQMILEGQIASTVKASTAINSLSDFEVAKTVAFNGVAQFEGMHYLAPDNEDALFGLTKGWAGVGFGFILDEAEQAQDLYGEESEIYRYHKSRAVAAFERAIYYGGLLLDQRNPGFEAAKKNAQTMEAWLAKFTDAERDVPTLFWLGQAWMYRTKLLMDDATVVGELFIGYQVMKRAAELDDTFLFGLPPTVLGAYHARSALAELDESKKQFDRSLEISGGKMLITKFQLATTYYCAKVDKEGYIKTLKEIIEAGDTLPEARLQNTIAKRRARRFLTKKRMAACGFE